MKGKIERRKRMEAVKGIIENQGSDSFKRLVGVLMLNFGISKRDAREELEGVIFAEGYELKGDVIYGKQIQEGSQSGVQDQEAS